MAKAGRPPGSKGADPWNVFRRISVGDGCCEWLGALDINGYGRAYLNGRETKAHRMVYELVVGPIPDGMELDHLCRNPRCVRPNHLEPVTHRENVLRGEGASAKNILKTHCPQGHEYTPENTYRWGSDRRCRECNRIRCAADYRRRCGYVS